MSQETGYHCWLDVGWDVAAEPLLGAVINMERGQVWWRKERAWHKSLKNRSSVSLELGACLLPGCSGLPKLMKKGTGTKVSKTQRKSPTHPEDLDKSGWGFLRLYRRAHNEEWEAWVLGLIKWHLIRRCPVWQDGWGHGLLAETTWKHSCPLLWGNSQSLMKRE